MLRRATATIAGVLLAGGVLLLTCKAQLLPWAVGRGWLPEGMPAEKALYVWRWSARFLVLTGFSLLWIAIFARPRGHGAPGTHGPAPRPRVDVRAVLLLIGYLLLMAACTANLGFYNLPMFVLACAALSVLIAERVVSLRHEDRPPEPGQPGGAGQPHEWMGPIVVLVAFVHLLYAEGVYVSLPALGWGAWACKALLFLLVLPYGCRRSAPRSASAAHTLWRDHHLKLFLALALLERVLLVLSSPAPHMDVFIVQQESALGLVHGLNPYAMVFSYDGGKSTIAYLPGALLLLVPARLLLGDIRFTYVACELAAAVLLGRILRRAGAGRTGVAPGALVCLLLLNPLSLFVLEQAWTEPGLLLFLFLGVFLLQKGVEAGGIATTGFLVAMKQPMVFLPLFLLRARVWNLRALIGCGAVAAGVVLPFFLWSPHDFIEDTILFPARIDFFPDTLNLHTFLVRTWGAPLPGAVGGALFLLGLLLLLRGTRPGLQHALSGFVLALFVFFFLMKQASLNYYYLMIQALLLPLGLRLLGPEGHPLAGRSAGQPG